VKTFCFDVSHRKIAKFYHRGNGQNSFMLYRRGLWILFVGDRRLAMPRWYETDEIFHAFLCLCHAYL